MWCWRLAHDGGTAMVVLSHRISTEGTGCGSSAAGDGGADVVDVVEVDHVHGAATGGHLLAAWRRSAESGGASRVVC